MTPLQRNCLFISYVDGQYENSGIFELQELNQFK